MATVEAQRPDNVLSGIFWMVITTFLFVGVTASVRYLGTSIPAPEAAFLRYAFGTILMIPFFGPLFSNPPSRSALSLFALRGVVHGIGVILWFYAMARIPIAEVTALGYIAPIFVTIGAAIFLGERLRWRRIIAVLAALIGALIILRPGFQEVGVGQLAQVGAAPLFAASTLIAKRLTQLADPSLIVGLLSLLCTIVLLPPALMNWVDPTWTEVGFLAFTAVIATAGHYTMTLAMRAAPITVTQPIQFIQLVWATLLGVFAFGEAADPFVLLGGAIIVGSATFISHREARASRRAITPPAAATKF